MASDDLQRLLRWEGSGGSWRVVGHGDDVVRIDLLTCAGDQVMDVLVTAEVDVRAHLAGRVASDDG
jgi:hypothetical protein